MGPIDYSKFDKVIKEYAAFYDLKKIAQKLDSLKKTFRQFSDYIDLINDEKKLEKIVTADNTELENLKKLFDKCTPNFDYRNCKTQVKNSEGKMKDCGTCNECQENNIDREFHGKIMTILNYDPKGKQNARLVYSKIGMKTCYICNAQYALAIRPETPSFGIKSKQERYTAKFQLDHYLPKAKYPALSISLFNLLPICSSCNSIKGEREIGIDFLTTDAKNWEGKFRFNIDDSSLPSFLLNQEPLEIDFSDRYKYADGVSSFSSRYDIKGIYNTQIDLIEELILRKLKYSETYKNKLNDYFPELFKNIEINERIELGAYTKKDGIHQRPMSKFIQDIDEQLDDYFSKNFKI